MSFHLVIFDLGGVLVRLDSSRMLKQLSQETGKSEEQLKQIVTDPALLEPFELGRVGPQHFFEQFSRRLNLSWSFDEFVTAWNSILSENPETTWLLHRLRERYTLAVLSNTDTLHDEYVRRSFPIFSHIRHWIVSYQVGLRKPEPQIYELALRRANVPPHAAVYVDDTEEFVMAARRLGLTAVHFTDGLKLEQELHAVGLHV
jgi:putative hydrolase of the HAD superfamily